MSENVIVRNIPKLKIKTIQEEFNAWSSGKLEAIIRNGLTSTIYYHLKYLI